MIPCFTRQTKHERYWTPSIDAYKLFVSSDRQRAGPSKTSPARTNGTAFAIATPVPLHRAPVNKLLVELLFGGPEYDPFAVLPQVQPDRSFQWSNLHRLWLSWIVENLVEPNFVVDFWLEVGSFKGNSIVTTADYFGGRYVPPAKTPPSLVCMDPWTSDMSTWLLNAEFVRTGNRSNWTNAVMAAHDFLSIRTARREKIFNGQPKIYEYFTANVFDRKAQNLVLPLQITSTEGLRMLASMVAERLLPKPPQVIYLDAAHREGETFTELQLAWALLPQCGVLMGDDFSWVGVRNDVLKFANNYPDVLKFTNGDGVQSPLILQSPNWAMQKQNARNLPCVRPQQGL